MSLGRLAESNQRDQRGLRRVQVTQWVTDRDRDIIQGPGL